MLWQPTRNILQPNQSWRRPQTPSGGGFTPPDLGTDLLRWYDASDAATFTFSSGSDVSTWADKSGNGKTLSAGGNTPVLTASVQNGLAAVRVGSGGSRSNLNNSGGAGWATEPDEFAVIQVLNRLGGGLIVQGGGLEFEASQSTSSGIWGVHSGGPVTANTALNTATTYLVETWGRGLSTSPNDGGFYLNGVSDGTYNSVGEPTDSDLRLANGYFTGMDGYLMEVILTNHLSAANRVNVEGYLKTKWGL